MDLHPTLYLIDACSGSGMLGLSVNLALDFRVRDGLACGMDADRLRLTGNGVVPLQAAYAFVSLIAVIIGDEVTKC